MNRGYILPLLSLLFASCDKGDDLLNSGKMPIAIEVEAPTRGAMVEDEAGMGSIGLFCEYTGSGNWDSADDFDKMNNTEFTYKNNMWETKDPKTWDHKSITDKYSFNAYSPYNSTDNGITASIKRGEISIAYTMPPDCAKQPDLMVATPRKNIFPQTGGKVHLEFNHMLASIGFKVKGNTTMMLISVTIKNLPSTATLTTYNGKSFVWGNYPTTPADFAAGIAVTSPTSETNAILATDPKDGYIMAIPQTIPSNVEVEVKYSTSSGDKVKTQTFPANTKWEASHQYLYTITLD